MINSLVDINSDLSTNHFFFHQKMIKLPLKGIKILDMTRILAGYINFTSSKKKKRPISTQYLGDLGCEVFKIEKPVIVKKV